MERNANDTFGTTGDQGVSTGGTGSLGGTGGTTGMEGSTGYGTTGTTGTVGTGGAGTGGTSGEGRLEQAKHTVQDKLGQVKEKSRNLQSSLADKLDAGAEKLRQRGQSGASYATGTTAGATTGVATDDRMANVQDSVAKGMHKSADWLRNGDLQQDIERQVRDNPGRTLLIALGVGYLLGKAFRGNR